MKKLLLLATACATLFSLTLTAMEDSELVDAVDIEQTEESPAVTKNTEERKPLGADPATWTPKGLDNNEKPYSKHRTLPYNPDLPNGGRGRGCWTPKGIPQPERNITAVEPESAD